ncbi:MAG: endonuclease/exonuclease/phosphatase family protein [Deltaproteobacteria bacterium]|nr:endonuclease/exonuclease/phosphatase family protein [Deltaproteobacteria bacterium]
MNLPLAWLRTPLLLALLALGGPLAGCLSDEVDVTSGSGGAGSTTGTGASGVTTTGSAPATTSTASGGTEVDALTVATWNVHNLFDEVKNGNVPFEDVDPNFAAHRKAVATVIDSLAPELFMLQEVESQPVLDALNADLAKPYEHAKLIEGNDPRGIDVAILSRIPFDKVVSHKSDKFLKKGTTTPLYNFSRDCLEVHLTANGRHVVLLGVHYKSKDSDDPDKRLAEAQHTRVIANGLAQADPSAAILILGDFNDDSGTATLEAIVNGTPPFLEVADAVPKSDRWTYKYGGKLFLIDHILANPVIDDMLDPTSVKIIHTKSASAASDHAPIFASFDLK